MKIIEYLHINSNIIYTHNIELIETDQLYIDFQQEEDHIKIEQLGFLFNREHIIEEINNEDNNEDINASIAI